MGTSLNGLTPAATYQGLIKFGDNSIIGATAKYLSDGAGNDLPISVSTSNVGIGSTSPYKSLSVRTSTSTEALEVRATTGNTGVRFSIADASVTTDTYSKGAIYYLNTGASSAVGTMIFALNNAFTSANVTTADERMRLVPSGNLGIGSTNPTSRLHIKGSGATSSTTSLLVDKSDGNTSFLVRDDAQSIFYGGVAMNFYNASQYLNIKGAGTTNATYSVKVTNSAATSLFLIQDDGKVVVQNNTLTVSGYGARINNLQVGVLGSKTISSTDTDSAVTITGSGVVVTGGGTTGTPNASALLQVDSTVRGFLPPRMTTTQKNAIATPAAGLMVFDTTLAKLCVYSGSAWETITSV